MIRRVQLNINYSNLGKKNKLDLIFTECRRVVNEYIDCLWDLNDFSSKFVDFKVDSWLSARMLQCLGKQALEIVKSQRKKKKKSKPTFNKDVLNLDSRFIDIIFDSNSFDCWFKLGSIGNKIILKLPSKKHKHFNSYFNNTKWTLNKSIRLRKLNNKYYIDVYFESDKPELKTTGKQIGLDCGYKKLLISSENKKFDVGLEDVYKKISKKKQGSKSFYRALTERDNKINQSINLIGSDDIKTIVVEDLLDVKKNSKGKIRKSFNNKLQRWSYSKVLSKLSMNCEVSGVDFIKVNPAYTSQTCSRCGFKHKDNRSLESFTCLSCGFEIDADYNASINILHRGVYSLSTTKNNFIYS